MTKPIITIKPHEESIEVRVSRYFYFDDNPSRRSITRRMSREEAIEAAQEKARQLRDQEKL
jgi:hypothetical protein